MTKPSCKVYGQVSITDNLVARFLTDDTSASASSRYVVFPGFCDVHVHFREPGFSYKETIASGSRSAAAGGYTAVCTMPNLNPVPDSVESIALQQHIIDRDACIHVYPYASITAEQRGETLVDMRGLAPHAIGFSDDGRGVQSESLMREAMLLAKSCGKMIVAHCEDNALLHGGYIHDGAYAAAHGHKGICSESEYGPIIRDLRLAEETGCAYHVCHISAAESVEAIRQAKKRGVNVTCETGPHYLVLDDSCMEEDGRFKMNPPLRSKRDREALLEGIYDGTIDMIATDHAPHSAEEKGRGLAGSSFGIVGLETAFPVLYTHLVKTGKIAMERLLDLMVYNPRKRFNIPLGDEFSVWDLSREVVVDPERFMSMGRATPFTGHHLYGECVMTVCDGKLVYENR
ncbi:MAG: dihydroorotase [Clostridia bacterium]|nr:dihydroorotase [Clostridia bacterium]